MFVALSITANAECEVNGYYRKNGTWVNGYTKSGDCWNGKVIGYDAQGRTAEERRAIEVKQNRIIIPFILLLIIFLAIWGDKLAEDSRLLILIYIILYPAALYLLYMIFLDPLVLVVIIFGLVALNWLKEKKKSVQISKKKKNYLSTTAISDINNIENKFQLFDHLVKNNLIYRENNSYKLTEKGIDIGGEYRSNKNALQWIVWKKDCLDKYISELKKMSTNNTSIGRVITLKSKKLNSEFIEAKNDILANMDYEAFISRELAVALYKIDQRQQLYNDNFYTVFVVNEFGVIIQKINGHANSCRLVHRTDTLYNTNKNIWDNYFTNDSLDK